MQIIDYSSSFIPSKNQGKLLTSELVFVVNRYECFMEYKNLISTLQTFQKTKLSLIKILLVLIKNVEAWINSEIHRVSKSRKVKKLCWELPDQHKIKFKNYCRFIWEKTKHSIISEVSWCIVLWREGSDYCVNNNFPGTFVDFRLKIFTQERICCCVNACL